MSILSKEQLLNAPADLVYETVPVPEWGGDVILRSLTGADRMRIHAFLQEHPNVDPVSVNLAVAMVDESHTAILPLERKSVEFLMNRSALVTERLYGRLRNLSPQGPQGVESEKKDSAPTPG